MDKKKKKEKKPSFSGLDNLELLSLQKNAQASGLGATYIPRLFFQFS